MNDPAQTTSEKELAALRERVQALTQDNERLKQEIQKLRARLGSQAKNGGMSTRLTDALRE